MLTTLSHTVLLHINLPDINCVRISPFTPAVAAG